MKNLNDSAFSLIELSIVLIIIGLLIAGVTGGASLIESAKVTASINELNAIKRDIYTFRARNNKFPGDVNDDGNIGACYGSGCTNSSGPTDYVPEPKSSSFGGIYSGVDVWHTSASWVDMYLDNITTFRADPNYTNVGGYPLSSYNNKTAPGFAPISKNNVGITFNTYRNFSATAGNCRHQIPNGIYILARYYKNSVDDPDDTTGFNPSFVKKIDTKADDGDYVTGTMRTCCYGSGTSCSNTYDDATTNKKTCSYFLYKIVE